MQSTFLETFSVLYIHCINPMCKILQERRKCATRIPRIYPSGKGLELISTCFLNRNPDIGVFAPVECVTSCGPMATLAREYQRNKAYLVDSSLLSSPEQPRVDADLCR